MKVLARQFNIYLALVVLLGLACGCQTTQKKQTAALRVHIETSPDPAGTSQTISVLRSDPVLITVKSEPILTEANIVGSPRQLSPAALVTGCCHLTLICLPVKKPNSLCAASTKPQRKSINPR